MNLVNSFQRFDPRKVNYFLDIFIIHSTVLACTKHAPGKLIRSVNVFPEKEKGFNGGMELKKNTRFSIKHKITIDYWVRPVERNYTIDYETFVNLTFILVIVLKK